MNEVRNAYHRLLERAAAAGFVAPGGVTPREAVAPLADALSEQNASEAAKVAEFTDLVERCVYAECATRQERVRATQWCEAIYGLIPELPPSGTVSPKRRWNFRRLTHALMIAVVAMLLWLVVRSSDTLFTGLPDHGAGARATPASSPVNESWLSNQGADRIHVAAHSDHWPRPVRDVTWRTMHVDPTLHDTQPKAFGATTFDDATGIDGVFASAIDPFTPALHWTHRLIAYDRVNARYEFQPAARSGRSAQGRPQDDEQEYRVVVDIQSRPGGTVAIPSPGPAATITAYRAEPSMHLVFSHDDGDALYVTCPEGGSVRLHYSCSVNRQRYDRAPLPDTPFAAQPTALPANCLADAQQVIATIGGLPAPTYEATVRRLHAYFAGFSVAPIQPAERRANGYLTVALARKGVCRHRARSFFITATALGIPTRLVENRCHSFCEVQLPDGTWRRLEFRLGHMEGPPGVAVAPVSYTPPRGIAPDALLLMLSLTIGLVALPLLFAWRVRQNSTMYSGIHDSRRHLADERAVRDDLLRRMQIGSDLRALTLDEVGAAGREAPLPLARRVMNLAHSSHPPRDANDLQQIYWDCAHILRWINGRGPR